MRVPTFLAAAALCAAPARAAEIAVSSFAGPTPVITVRGEIGEGDDLKFTRFAAVFNAAVVELDSTGGHLAQALAIGDVLARHGFSTYVGPRATCSSACGLIWLAGHPRVQHATGRIGFHAAYVPDGQGVNRENGLSNALIGSYMTRLDLGTEAIMFATAAAPDRMAWITPELGARYGIAFEVVDRDLASLKTAGPRDAPAEVVGSVRPRAPRSGLRPPAPAVAMQPGARE